MAFLDQLLASASGPASSWIQFTMWHGSPGDQWFLFVEGKLDVALYVNAMRAIVLPGGEIRELKCGNKKGVLDAQAKVRAANPDCRRCLFFVDKDLDDVLGNATPSAPDTYVTAVHSIENLFVSKEALDVVWCQVWSLPSADSRLSATQAHLSACLQVFYRRMIPIVGWMVGQWRRGNRPSIAGLDLQKIIKLRDGKPFIERGSLRVLEAETNCGEPLPVRTWLAEARALRGCSPKRVIRGKWELWLFCNFLVYAQEAIRQTGIKPLPSTNMSANAEGIACALAGKLSYPGDLACFLRRAVASSANAVCVHA